MQGHTSTSRLVTFIIHPKQINEYSNIHKRCKRVIVIPESFFSSQASLAKLSNSALLSSQLPPAVQPILFPSFSLRNTPLFFTLFFLKTSLQPNSPSSVLSSQKSPFFSLLLKLNYLPFLLQQPAKECLFSTRPLKINSPLFSFSSFFLDLPSQRSLLQPPFSLPPFLPHSFCSHLSCHIFGRHLFCPTPFAALKSEVDSLWALRM